MKKTGKPTVWLSCCTSEKRPSAVALGHVASWQCSDPERKRQGYRKFPFVPSQNLNSDEVQ